MHQGPARLQRPARALLGALLGALPPAGCASATDETGDAPTADGGAAAPYLGEIDESEAPAIDAEALGAGLDQAIAAILQVQVGPVLAAYDALAEQMEPGCPDWYESEGLAYWYDSCTTAGGTRFQGYAYLTDYVDYASEGTVWNGRALTGVGEIEAADGALFRANGQATAISGVNADGNPVWWTAVDDFAYDGAEAEGTWLAQGLEPGLRWYAVLVPGSDGRVLSVSGSLAGTAGIDAIALDEVLIADAGMGSPCPEEPSGTVALLDPEGRWIDVVFDGPTWDDWGLPASDCDGCGRAFWQGQDLGQVCADFSPLTAWESEPG